MSGNVHSSQKNERQNILKIRTVMASKKELWPHSEEMYGANDTAMWYYRWQIFYVAWAELFAFERGDTWGVSHYLFEKAALA